MPRSDQTEFVVHILEGPNTGRKIRLSGRALPYRAGAGGSISFGRTQRTKRTWYPGNRSASQQIIGPTLKDTVINGVWKEKKLGEDAPINLVETFEILCSSGVQVRVFWQTIERFGIVKDIEWFPGDPTGGLSDIRWQITFEWNSTGRTRSRIVGASDISFRDSLIRAARKVAALSAGLQELSLQVGSFVGQTKRIFEPSRTQLDVYILEYEQPLQTIVTSAARMGDESNTPARLIEDASAAVGSAQTTSGEVAEFVPGIFTGAVIDDDSLESVLNDADDRGTIVNDSYEVMEDLFDERVRLEELVRPDTFTTITANPGEDLRQVAINFYGNADDWDRIAERNGIEGSIVPEDVEEIIVPLSLPDALDKKVGC